MQRNNIYVNHVSREKLWTSDVFCHVPIYKHVFFHWTSSTDPSEVFYWIHYPLYCLLALDVQ